jgi:hypothetical protein
MSPQAQAILTAGDPVKNARAILRNALPIDNKPIRKIQSELESINDALRIPGSKSLGPVARSVRTAESTLQREEKAIIAAFAADKKADGLAALAGLKGALSEFDTVLETNDKQAVPAIQQKCLRFVGSAEEAMVKAFPFEVLPALPLLRGSTAHTARCTHPFTWTNCQCSRTCRWSQWTELWREHSSAAVFVCPLKADPPG